VEEFEAVQLTIPFFWDHISKDLNISEYILPLSSRATALHQDSMTLEDEGNTHLHNIWNILPCYPVVRCHIPEWYQYLISVLCQVLPG
jgi:hypothetical protein